MAMATANPNITASRVTTKTAGSSSPNFVVGRSTARTRNRSWRIDRENAEQIVARIDRNLELRRMLRQPPAPPSRIRNRQEIAIVLTLSALVGLVAGASSWPSSCSGISMNAILLDTAPAGADQGASVPYSPRIDGLLMPDEPNLGGGKTDSVMRL